MSKILITGSAGLVGSACMEFFAAKQWETIGVDNNQRAKLFGTPEHQGHINVDITDPERVEALFKLHAPFTAIIHAAGQPSHDWAKNDPLKDFDINARGTLILLEATRKYSPDAVFVYVSTDKVYGENMERGLEEQATRYHSDFPFNESEGLDFAGNRSLFGCSKTAADLYVQEYGNYFDMYTACFRPGCITGKNHEGAEYHGFLAYLAQCIRTGIRYKIFGYKGKQVRDQIHALDLASAFWHFIQFPRKAAVYNIGGGPERSVSVNEAIALIEKETSAEAITEYSPIARRGDRIWDVHDVSKFRNDYPDWDYEYSLDAIIKDVCKKDL